MKKVKNLMPADDEIIIAVFKIDEVVLTSFDLVKVEDAKDFEDGLISKYGHENFAKNYISFAIDLDTLNLIIKSGILPLMRIMAEESGYKESEEDKRNFEYFYGSQNKEIN